jgi:hypothetical protein
MTASTFPEMVRRIFTQQTTAFKINLSFGLILRNVETGEHHWMIQEKRVSSLASLVSLQVFPGESGDGACFLFY